MATLIKEGLQNALMQAATLGGRCYIVNGFDKNISFDGWVDPTEMGIVAPTDAATDEGTDIAGSLIVGGKYKCKYEYYNINKGQPSGMSPASAEITCQSLGGIRVNIPANANVDSQVTHIRAYLTSDGGNIYRYDDSKAYTGSAITFDFTAAENQRVTLMGELSDDETYNVDVHLLFPVVPYIIAHKGRLFGFGTKIFSKGTASVTNGSATVTIADTTLPTGIKNLYFHIYGDSRKYIIQSRTDGTHFELTETYGGTTGSGKTYYIYGENSIVYYTYIDTLGSSYPESCPSTYWIEINKDDDDEGSGLGIVHDQIVVFKIRSVGILSGSSPSDFAFTLISTKVGCISAYTIDKNSAGHCLFLSEKGLCITDGVSVINLTESTIGNIFTGEGSPPWEVNKSRLPYAVGKYDPMTNRYRLWVSSKDATTNDKYLEYDFNKIGDITIGWTDGDGIVGHACGIIEIDGVQKLAFGCDGGKNADKGFVYYYDEDATNDGAGTTSTKTGTVTSATDNTLTDSSATFTDDILGCNVKILSGTGIGQIRRIYTRESATQFTVESNWTTNPDTTSVYAIGFIDAFRLSKHFDFGALGSKSMRMIKTVFKKAAYNCDFKLYQDYSTTPKIEKDINLNKDKGFYEFRLGLNRAKHYQIKVGKCNVDTPIEIKEHEFTYVAEGKPQDFQ